MLNVLKNIKNTIKKAINCGFIKIDLSFFVVFLIAFLVDEIYFYIVYVISMLLHEISHLIVAKKLGYYPSKIKLSFFGAKLEGGDDFFIRDEIKIVLAGPIFNFCVIILCYLCFWFYPESYNYLYDVLVANFALLVFNCLPVFPLDMGRCLLAVLSLKHNRVKALNIVKKISIICTISLFVLYVISFLYFKNFAFGFMCVNLMNLCLSSAKDTSYKRRLFIKRKFDKLSKGLPEKNIYVGENQPLYSLYKYIDDSHFVNFMFLDDNLTVKKRLTEIEFYNKLGLDE